jgi:hypothetical protein
VGALARGGIGAGEESRAAAVGATSTGRDGTPDLGGFVDPGATAPPHQRLPAGLGGAPAAPTPPPDLSKIVRDGSISLTIPDGTFEERFAKVVAIAHANGGAVLSSQTQGSSSGSLTLRIPASRFDQAMLQLRGLGDATATSVTGKDVTAEYVDERAHLQILRTKRAVLLQLMNEATTIGQTIAIENQVSDVQLAINQIEGRLRYIDDQVARSTIDVDLVERHAVGAAMGTGIRNPSLGSALDRAVQGFLAVIATVIVGLGYLVPAAALAGLVLLVVTLVRRRGLAAT